MAKHDGVPCPAPVHRTSEDPDGPRPDALEAAVGE
jgi:hypothetical protein